MSSIFDERLRGVFAPVVTPFENDEIRFDWLKENIESLNESGLKGYLSLGSNGEFKSLTEKERIKVAEVFGKEKGNNVLMVGTGCESVKETIEWTNQAAGLGADFASIITPHYFASQMGDKELISYYQEVADKSRIPVLLYNVPKFAANVKLSVNAVKVLSKHPNIVGMKDTGGASIFNFLANVDRKFSVLAGSSDYLLPAVLVGATGGIVSLANCFPDVCCKLYNAVITGNMKEAGELHTKILQVNAIVSGKSGVAGVKAAMTLAGFKGGMPRRPLQPLADSERETMRSKLKELGIVGA